MVNLKINGIPVEVPAGSTVLEAARKAGIRIPTLCYLKDINEIGACRMCLVEVKGARSLVTSCVYPVSEGMEVFTNTPAVQRSHKATLELLLSNHRKMMLQQLQCQNEELHSFIKAAQGVYLSPKVFWWLAGISYIASLYSLWNLLRLLLYWLR